MLRQMESLGVIRRLRRQVPYPLVLPGGAPVLLRGPATPKGRTVRWVADFVYEERRPDGSWAEVVEDTKGYGNKVAMLKIAMVEAIHNIRVRITGDAARSGARVRVRRPGAPIPLGVRARRA
jgi:hypothetical protein